MASTLPPVLMPAKRLVITSDGSLRQQQRCNSGATALTAPFIRGSRSNAMAGRRGDCGHTASRQYQCTVAKAAQTSGAAPVQEISMLCQLENLRFEGPKFDLRSLYHKSLRDSLQEKPSRSFANEQELVSLAVLDFFDQVEKEVFRTVDLADPSVHSVQDLETLVQLPLVFLKVRSLLTLKLLLFSKPSCYMFRCSLSAVTAGKAATCIPYRNHADMVIFQTAALRGRSDDGATHSSRLIADNVTLKMQRLQQQPELD